MTDIWGGNRCGLLTIWVDPISPVEWWGTRVVHRTMERFLVKQMEGRGIVVEVLGRAQTEPLKPGS
jgi:predicted HAD superfamily phosphohydrolase YqeG